MSQGGALNDAGPFERALVTQRIPLFGNAHQVNPVLADDVWKRNQVVGQRGSPRLRVQEHERTPSVDTGLAQAEASEVNLAHVLEPGHAPEPAVQVEGPRMVRAPDAL